MIKQCFCNRTPSALTGLLHKVSELCNTSISSASPETSSTVPILSHSTTSVSLYRTSLSHATPRPSATKEERLLIASMEYVNTVASKYAEELTAGEALATSACEIVLQMRDGGHGLTPTGVHLGLLSNLCGFTNQGQDILSAKGITCGRPTSKKIIDGLTKEYEKDVSNNIRKEAGNKKK